MLPFNFSTKEVFVMRNFLAKSLFFGLVVVLAFSATNTYSCMSFRVTAKDGNVMIGRTMEFGVDSRMENRCGSSQPAIHEPGSWWKKGSDLEEQIWIRRGGGLGVGHYGVRRDE